MLHDIVRDAARDMAENTARIASLDCRPEQRLIALVLLYMAELFQDGDAFAILHNERRFFRRHPDFQYVDQAKHAMFTAWRTVIGQGISAGEFRGDGNILLTISTFVRMLNGGAEWFWHDAAEQAAGLGSYSREQLVDFHVDLIVRTLRIPARLEEPLPRAEAEALTRLP